MKKEGIIIITMILIFSMSLIVSSKSTDIYGYYNSNLPSMEIDNSTTSNGYTNNTNSSNYWNTNIGSLNNVNSTQFSNNGGTLNILISWFTSQWNTIFETKTTDDLIEGSTNLYDNKSFNQTLTDSLYSSGGGSSYWDRDSGNGYLTPSTDTDSIVLKDTTANKIGVIYKGTKSFIHNFYGSGTTGYNTFVGIYSGNFNMGGTYSYQGSYNNGIGYNTLNKLTEGYQNNAIGSTSLHSTTTGYKNNGMGYQSLYSLTTGSENTAVGADSMSIPTSARKNVAIGANTLSYSNGMNNVGVGYKTGKGAYGYDYSYNTFLGSQAGYLMRTGSNNIFLGYDAGYRQTTNSNLFIVDNQMRADTATEESNAILYGTMASSPSSQTLRINGAVALGDNSLGGLSSGDINVSTIYYDTLTAKSPIIICSDDWCSVDFPKERKQIYIHKNISWDVDEIIYNEKSYTKQSFWQLVQGTQYEDLALKLNAKLNRLQDKYNCESQGYTYNGTCYEITETIFSVNYNDAVNKIPEYNYTITKYPCTILNEKLEEVESTCSNSSPTMDIIGYNYQFKDNCYYDDGYKCKIKKIIKH